MACHSIKKVVDNREIETFEDIIPQKPEIKILFIGKVPAPASVRAGHYFYKNKNFWGKLKKYNILDVPDGENEDDYLIQHDYGITDIIKVPREYGDEPSDLEYRQGIPYVFELLQSCKPKILIFIYKKVLDKILYLEFGIKKKSQYGFNKEIEHLFGCRVFVFPMPGTPCDKDNAHKSMAELANVYKKMKLN